MDCLLLQACAICAICVTIGHMAKRTKKADKPAQTKISQFFDNELMPLIRAGASEADMSMTAYVQELVKAGLPKKVKR